MIRGLLQPFDDYPEEGRLVGRILVAYSELDIELALLVGAVLGGSFQTAVRTLYRLRGEDSRLQVADAIVREPVANRQLKNEYEALLGAMRWCKGVRNQYAHCLWHTHDTDGLFFTDLDRAAKTTIGEIMHQFWHVDAPLLEQQERYFDYTAAWLGFVRHEFEVRAGLSAGHDWEAPTIIEPPPRHNSPDQHPLHFDSSSDPEDGPSERREE